MTSAAALPRSGVKAVAYLRHGTKHHPPKPWQARRPPSLPLSSPRPNPTNPWHKACRRGSPDAQSTATQAATSTPRARGDFTATAASSSSGESAPGPPQKEPPKPRQPPPAADFRHSQPTALYRQVFGHGRDPPATPAGSTAIAGHPVQEDDLEHEEPPETAAAAAAAAESPSQTTDDAWEKLRASLQHLDADPIVGTRQEPEPSLAPGQQHGSQPLHQQQEPLTGEAPHQPQIQPPAEEQATAAATSSRARSASTQRRGAQDPPQQVHRLPPLEPWSRKRRPWQQPPRQIPQKQHDFHDRADPQGGDPPAQEAEPSQQPAAEGPHHEAQPDAPQHASGERQSRHPGTLAHSTFTSTSSSSRSRRRPRPQPPQMRPEKAHNETTGTVATQQQGKLPRTTNGHQHGGPPLTQRTRKLSPIRGRRQTARSTAAHPAGTSEATSSSGRKGNAQLARPTRRGHRTPQPSNGDDIPPALETREPAIKQTKRGSTRNLRNERQTPARTHQPGLFTKLLNLHLQPRTPPQGTPQQTGPSDPTAASSTQAPHMPQQGTQAQSAGPQQEDPTSKQATLAQQQAEERMQQPGPKAAAKGTGPQPSQPAWEGDAPIRAREPPNEDPTSKEGTRAQERAHSPSVAASIRREEPPDTRAQRQQQPGQGTPQRGQHPPQGSTGLAKMEESSAGSMTERSSCSAHPHTHAGSRPPVNRT